MDSGGLQLTDALADGIRPEDHIDDIGGVALFGGLAIQLAELEERLVRAREPALTLEQQRLQRDRGRGCDDPIGLRRLTREQPEPLEFADDRTDTRPPASRRQWTTSFADAAGTAEHRSIDGGVCVVESQRFEHAPFSRAVPWRILAMAFLRHNDTPCAM